MDRPLQVAMELGIILTNTRGLYVQEMAEYLRSLPEFAKKESPENGKQD